MLTPLGQLLPLLPLLPKAYAISMEFWVVGAIGFVLGCEGGGFWVVLGGLLLEDKKMHMRDLWREVRRFSVHGIFAHVQRC